MRPSEHRGWLPAILLLSCPLAAPVIAAAGQCSDPEFRIAGRDAPNDAGGNLILEWPVLAMDSGIRLESDTWVSFRGYQVFRASTRAGPYESVGFCPPAGPQTQGGTAKVAYTDSTPDGRPFYYHVAALGKGDSAYSDTIGPLSSSAQWFRSDRLNFVVLALIFGAVILGYIERAKRGKMFIRRIAGLDAIDEAVGRATEMGRPILYSFGLSVVNDVTTLASLSIFGRVARKAAEYATRLLCPNNDPLVMTAARETAKQAYAEAGRPDLYDEGNISYVTGDQFGYAAGVDGMVMRDKPGAVFWQGYFYAEALILAETGHSVGAIQIAGTTSIEQLPFFVVACDYTLLGEEMFAASCYLNPEPQMMGSLKGEDFIKVMIIVVLGGLSLLGTIAVILSRPGSPSSLSSIFDAVVNWFTQA